jgi:1,4-alpha-glucan branching enzyme
MGWMNDTLRYISADPVFRKYDHHMITFSLLYAFSENFILPISHDEVVHGKRSLLNKMPGDRWQQFANARVYLMYQTAHPGKRLCFMGTEFAQVNEWNESQSLEWHLLKYEEHRTFHAFYKKLNRFYCEQPALYAKDFESSGFEWIDACDHENSVLSFIRHSKTLPEQHLTFIFNFTPVPRSDYLVGASDKTTYEKIFDTDANEFGGSGFNNQSIIKASEKQWQGRPYSINVDLPPLGAIVLRDKK